MAGFDKMMNRFRKKMTLFVSKFGKNSRNFSENSNVTPCEARSYKTSFKTLSFLRGSGTRVRITFSLTK
jgi:hypothetical protein